MSKATMPPVRLAGYPRRGNPNHHLFNTRGTWFLQITIHRGPVSERLRGSLKTKDLGEARRKRDVLIARLAEQSQPV